MDGGVRLAQEKLLSGKVAQSVQDAWERCLQFNKTKEFNMYQEAVMVPMGDWAKKRLKHLSEADQSRDTSKVGSGFGKNVSNWVDRKRLTRQTCCTWRQKPAIEITARFFPNRCPNGSSNCLRRKTIGCLTRLRALARRVRSLRHC